MCNIFLVVGLIVEVYSIKTLDGEVKKVHKGVSRSFQRDHIKHEDYVEKKYLSTYDDKNIS